MLVASSIGGFLVVEVGADIDGVGDVLWFTVAGRLYGKVIGNGRVRAMVRIGLRF